MKSQKHYTLITLLLVALSIGCSTSGSGRVVNNSETKRWMGLAPWTENKPTDERYQVLRINEENTPFTGKVADYGYTDYKGKTEAYLGRISTYRNGELVEVIFFEEAKPLKLIKGRFHNKANADFPENEVAVFEKAHIFFSKKSTAEERHRVLEAKEWAPNGQLVLHGKNGRSGDTDPVRYDSPRIDGGRHSGFSEFEELTEWWVKGEKGSSGGHKKSIERRDKDGKTSRQEWGPNGEKKESKAD